MKDIIRIYNPTVRFLKLILNIKIDKEFEEFLSKLLWIETSSLSTICHNEFFNSWLSR